MLNVFGTHDGGCEDVMKEYAVFLLDTDEPSISERTIEYDFEEYEGEFIVTANFVNGLEFAFTASDYKDMFYYIYAIAERIEYYYNSIIDIKNIVRYDTYLYPHISILAQLNVR